MQRQWDVEHEGRTYTWVRGRWTCRGQVVPQAQWLPLERRLVDEVKARGFDNLSLSELMDVAGLFTGSGHWALAVGVLERVLAQDAGNAEAAVTLSRAYQRTAQPEKALGVTEPFVAKPTPTLLLTRAAALCDLERWNEARRTTLAAQKLGAGTEAEAVLERIRREQAREDEA
ncbi:MAG: CDC27 family protein [Myxococcaceae bacterium]|nr:CDC27 family protein [Myxococcaceae bacterium]MCI0671285.1 CDC27 family protein [Myxococcaceae bacterium]